MTIRVRKEYGIIHPLMGYRPVKEEYISEIEKQGAPIFPCIKVQAEGPKMNRDYGLSTRFLLDTDRLDEVDAFFDGLDHDHITLATDQYKEEVVSYKYYAEVEASLQEDEIVLTSEDQQLALPAFTGEENDRPTPLTQMLQGGVAYEGGHKLNLN